MTKSYDKDVGAGVVGAPCVVELESDATPFVRWIGARLRTAIRAGCCPTHVGRVLLRSTCDAQLATVDIRSAARIVVTHHAGAIDETLSVDPENDLTPEKNVKPSGLLRTIRELLAPYPASWREAATEFWHVNAGTRGMPTAIRLTGMGDDGGELVLGHGEPVIGIAGAVENLRRVLTGSTQLDDAIRRGDVRFHGTFPHMSVMVGAGWKVRMHD